MSQQVFSLDCKALSDLTLVGFRGTEGLNRPYEMDLFFTVPVGTDVKSAMGTRATLTADRGDGRGPMCWQGLIAKVRLLHETAERALYQALLVPKLWFLRHHVRSFVHTKKKLDEFVADTLKQAGFQTTDFDVQTHTSAYPTEEFVCQYRESHLDFLHRWLEREGAYYYFEHPEGDGAAEKVVFVDDKAQHAPLFGDGHVRYVPAAGSDATAGECFREIVADMQVLPAGVAITDYNYANPNAPLSGQKAVSGMGIGEIREYGYRVFSAGEAARLAQVKAESIACRELTLTATGSVLGLRAGYTFEVEDGPSDLPSKYLAIEVRHAGALSGASPLVMRYTGLDPKETYRVDVVAIPANTQFRAAQTTPWPRIYGFENGTVDGPGESQYAQIDDQGRYLVRFKFDASDLPDGSTSTYLRMMQPHGGTTEGWHFPLRKGTEVMVSFQGGDPDRPVIAGVVPNAVQPSNVTSKNHTQNVLRTGGGNYLVMDDAEEAQYIDGYTQVGNTAFHMGKKVPFRAMMPDAQGNDQPVEFNFTYVVSTDGDAGFQVGGSWWQSVGKEYWLDVTGNATVRYKSDHVLVVGGATTERYRGARTTHVFGKDTQNAYGGAEHYVDGSFEQTVTSGGKQSVTGRWEQIVSGENADNYGSWRTTVGGSWVSSVGGVVTMTVGGTVAVVSGADISFTSPSKITLSAPEVENVTGGSIITKTPLAVEFFGTKNAVGIHQFNATGINMAVDGSKREMVGQAFSLVGLKVEFVGAANEHTPLKLEEAAARVEKAAANVKQSAISLWKAALTSIG